MVRSSGEEVVSTSSCYLPEFQVKCTAEANNMICGGGNNIYTANQCTEFSPESLKWVERSKKL